MELPVFFAACVLIGLQTASHDNAKLPSGAAPRLKIGAPSLTHQGVKAMVKSREGGLLLSVSLNELRVWSLDRTGRVTKQADKVFKDALLSSAVFLSGGSQIAVCVDGAAVVLDLPSFAVSKTLANDGCTDVALTPNGLELSIVRALEAGKSEIRFISVKEGKTTRSFLVECEDLRELQITEDGNWIAGISGSAVHVWSITGRHIGTFRSDARWLVSFAFDATKNHLVATTSNGDLLIWQCEPQKLLRHAPVVHGGRNVTK